MRAQGIRKIISDSMANLIGMILPIGVGLVSVPMIISSIGNEKFAILSLMWMFVGYASLLDLGFGQALTKTLAERQADNRTNLENARHNWDLQLFLFLMGLSISIGLTPLLLWALPRGLKPASYSMSELSSALTWVVGSLPFVISSAGLRGALIAYHDFFHINVARTISGVLNFVVPLVFALQSGELAYMAQGLFWVRVVNWLYHGWVLHRRLPISLEMRLPTRIALGDVSRMAGWLTVTNLANVAIISLDRLLVGILVSTVAIAYYSAPYDVLSKMWLIPNAITPVLFPILVKDGIFDLGRLRRIYQIAEGVLLIVMFPVCLIISVTSPYLLKFWLGPEFANNAGAIASIITVGFFINTSAHVPFTALQALGQSRKAALFQLIQVPIFGLLLLIGGYYLGALGVAMAFTLRMAIDAIYFIIQGQRYVMADRWFDLVVIMFVFSGALAMIILSFFVSGEWRYVGVGIVLILFAAIWKRFVMNPFFSKTELYLRRVE